MIENNVIDFLEKRKQFSIKRLKRLADNMYNSDNTYIKRMLCYSIEDLIAKKEKDD